MKYKKTIIKGRILEVWKEDSKKFVKIILNSFSDKELQELLLVDEIELVAKLPKFTN